MIKLRTWAEYEKSDRLLIVYGAGNNGRTLLNSGKIVPDYFCDQNAAKIQNVVSDDGTVSVPCIDFAELTELASSRNTDIYISTNVEEYASQIAYGIFDISSHSDIYIYIYHVTALRAGVANAQTLITGKYTIPGVLLNNLMIARNSDILDYFKDKNINADRISISGNDSEQLCLMYITLFFYAGIKAYQIISPGSMRISPPNFILIKTVSVNNADFSVPILEMGCSEKENHYDFREIIKYSAYKNFFVNLLKEKINGKRVPILFINAARTNFIKNANEHEKRCAECYWPSNGTSVLCEYIDVAYEGFSREYKEDILNRKKETFIKNMRVTTDLPESHENSVYFIGNSVSTSVFASDDNTIASQLQRKFNLSDKKYICCNYFVESSTTYDKKITEIIDSLDIKSGDVIVLQINTFEYKYFAETFPEFNMEIIDMQPYFDRPHDMGEVFVDHVHCNHKGYGKYAEVICDKLEEIGVLNNTYNYVYDFDLHNTDSEIKAAQTEDTPAALTEYLETIQRQKPRIGAIVMNCNPFTNGHRFLAEYAAAQTDKLYIFVVEEDLSFFPFKDRLELVRAGTADLGNVTVLPSGKYIISKETFRDYFEKTELQDAVINPAYDAELFGEKIAPALGINVRFAGEEPFDNVTRQYNGAMARILPEYGVKFECVPRMENGGVAVSASRVRELLKERNFDSIASIVPTCTLQYLKEHYRD